MNDWLKKWLAENIDDIAGIDLKRLKPGTKIVAETKNSTYTIIVVDQQQVILRGGRFVPAPIEAFFKGSNLDSTFRPAWIGFMMCMEFLYENKRTLTTSRVKSATVVGPHEDWSFTLDWPDLIPPG